MLKKKPKIKRFSASGMESAEKEMVPFSRTITPADAKGLVEKWLQQVRCSVPLPVARVLSH